MNFKKKKTFSIILAALFTALIAVFAQIPPSTHEFPITLQTFAIALCGFTLSLKYSLASIVTYILLGAAGAPVFSGFCGGIHHVTGPAGGFILGFPIFVLFCSLFEKRKNNFFKIFMGILGIIIMYIIGIIYYALVTSTPYWTAIVMYAPVLLKDVASCVLAFFVGRVLRKRIKLLYK